MTLLEPTPVAVATPFNEQFCKLCRFYIEYRYSDGGVCCRFPARVEKEGDSWCGEFMDKPSKVTP